MPLKHKRKRIVSAKKKRRPRAKDSLIRRHWRGSLSVKGNYERMGLAANPNRLRLSTGDNGTEENSKVVGELELCAEEARAKQAVSKAVYIDWHTKHMLSQLISRYGQDYEAMARDTKLNVWQRTAGQLRRQCSRLREATS